MGKKTKYSKVKNPKQLSVADKQQLQDAILAKLQASERLEQGQLIALLRDYELYKELLRKIEALEKTDEEKKQLGFGVTQQCEAYYSVNLINFLQVAASSSYRFGQKAAFSLYFALLFPILLASITYLPALLPDLAACVVGFALAIVLPAILIGIVATTWNYVLQSRIENAWQNSACKDITGKSCWVAMVMIEKGINMAPYSKLEREVTVEQYNTAKGLITQALNEKQVDVAEKPVETESTSAPLAHGQNPVEPEPTAKSLFFTQTGKVRKLKAEVNGKLTVIGNSRQILIANYYCNLSSKVMSSPNTDAAKQGYLKDYAGLKTR